MRNYAGLGLILLLGLLLRTWGGELLPPSLNWDEVSLGYNAYSVWQTGRDEWGQALPAYFRAFGDYKLPGYIYATVVWVAAFGLTPSAVRLTSVVAGELLIVVAYLLGRRVHSRRAGLVAALLVAGSAWTVWLSRVAVEANLAALFMALGGYLVIKDRPVLGGVFLGLATWTYNGLRIFAPLFLLWFLVLKKGKVSVWGWIVAATVVLVTFWQVILPEGLARYRWLALVDSGAVAKIVEKRQTSNLPAGLTRLVHNRLTYFVTQGAANYVSYFSPQFLFSRGGNHYQFSVQGAGLLSWANAVPLVVGIVFLVNQRQKFSAQMLLGWLFLAPVAGSLTRDAPHVLRSVAWLPVPQVVAALGLVVLVQAVRQPRWRQIIWGGYFVWLLITTEFWLTNVVPGYIKAYSPAWQYGYRQVVEYTRTNYAAYDSIVVTKKYGEPHEFFLFFWPWDPRAYQVDNRLVRYRRSDWYWVDSFANFQFVNDWELSRHVAGLPKGKRYLVVSGPDRDDLPGTEVFRVNFLDGQPAFVLWDYET